MNFIKRVLQAGVGLCRQGWAFVFYPQAHNRIFRVLSVDDEPERLSPGVLYVLEDAGQTWTAIMKCPGGCGQALHMNLIQDSKPVWTLTKNPDGSVSLSPSIWRKEGCGCHFWIRNSKINWC